MEKHITGRGEEKSLLGRKLVTEKVVTEDQLTKAVERQRLHGGRLGHNIVALGFMTPNDLQSFFKKRPKPPGSCGETGLDESFIADLVMKHIVYKGDFTIADLTETVKLPASVIDEALEMLRRDKFVEVKSAGGYARMTYQFSMTDQGRNRAAELFEICRYAGPAPVPLELYNRMVEFQTVKNIVVSERSVIDAFSHLVISERKLRRIGPAISSGKAIFIYGPAGNGKTTVAETIGRALPGSVYIPYSVIVGGQIISVYDAANHIVEIPEVEERACDLRWQLIKRPVIMTGGELTLRMLDLDFNSITKYYEAPLQMKANNGLFIIDDFGRQQMDPQNLLNRWVVPLERRTDFMTLITGMKFEIPFDQLVIFSTNIEPKKLVDEAFLRRIRYKIKIDHPSVDEYTRIFRRVCEANGMDYRPEMLKFLFDNFYRRLGVKLNACHPRDLIDHIIDIAHYYNHAPELSKEAMTDAWESYFVET